MLQPFKPAETGFKFAAAFVGMASCLQMAWSKHAMTSSIFEYSMHCCNFSLQCLHTCSWRRSRLVQCRDAAYARCKMNPVGLEPTIPGSVGRCLIHWATGPVLDRSRKHVIFQFATVLPGCQVTRTLRALCSCCNFNTDCLESRGT